MTRYGAASASSYPVYDPSSCRRRLMCDVEDGLRLTVLAERKFTPGQVDCAIAETDSNTTMIESL